MLKLSGEALMGDASCGIDAKVLNYIATQVKLITQQGVELAIVIGGGNLFRGASLQASGVERITADHIGMLATVMNGLAIKDALQQQQIPAVVMSAMRIDGICKPYNHQQAIRHLQAGVVTIFVAGTGNPLFTTDTAASLRAIEIQAQLMIKATKVNGVYEADPKLYPQARRFTRLSYAETIDKQLAVMDLTAVILCRDHKLALLVLDLNQPNALSSAISGQEVGTLIHSD